jgi:O-antigen/teichoic acid export membrane protein
LWNNLAHSWNRHVDDVAVLGILGTRALGLYTAGYRVLQDGVGIIGRTITTFLLPSITASVRQKDEANLDQLASYCRRMVLGSTALFCGASLASHLLVPVIFGADFDSAVPLWRVLALAGGAQVAGIIAHDFIQAAGQIKQSNRLATVGAVLTTITFSLLFFWPLSVVVWIYVARNWGMTFWLWRLARAVDPSQRFLSFPWAALAFAAITAVIDPGSVVASVGGLLALGAGCVTLVWTSMSLRVR